MLSFLSGYELAPPVEGERVVVGVHVIGSSAAMPPEAEAKRKGIVGSCTPSNANCVRLNTFENSTTNIGWKDGVVEERKERMKQQAFFVNYAFSSEVDRVAQIASSLLPTAVAPTIGVNASILCVRSRAVHPSYSLMDRSSRKPLVMTIIESVQQEASKRGAQVYLSVGVADGNMAVDLLACNTDSNRPTYTKIEPSPTAGTVLPHLQEVNITTTRRPAEVLASSFQLLTRYQQFLTISSEASVFVVLTISQLGKDGKTHFSSRLTLIDVCDMKQFQRLVLTDQQRLSVSLGDQLLPLLCFGPGLGSRCCILGNVPAICTPEDAELTKVVCQLHKEIVYPLNRYHIALQQNKEGGGKGGVTEYYFSEVMRLRKVINNLPEVNQVIDTAASKEELGQDLDTALDEVRRLNSILADKLPLVLDSQQFDAHTVALLNNRLEVIRQIEKEQSEKHKWLAHYHDWLLKIPVTQAGPKSGPVIDFDARLELLERSFSIQKEELERNKKIFARDIAVLKSELSAAQEVAKLRTPVTSPFQPAVDTFLEDIELLMTCNSDGGSDVMERFLVIVENFVVELKSNAQLCFDSPNSESSLKPSVDACVIVFKAAVENLRRKMRIPVAPPWASQRSNLEKYYEEIIFQKYACREERHRLRSIAEALMLHVERMLKALYELSKEVESINEKYMRAGDAIAGANQAEYGGGSHFIATQPKVAELLRAEMGKDFAPILPAEQRVNTMNRAANVKPMSRNLTAVPVLYCIEKCEGIMETLKLVVQGMVGSTPTHLAVDIASALGINEDGGDTSLGATMTGLNETIMTSPLSLEETQRSRVSLPLVLQQQNNNLEGEIESMDVNLEDIIKFTTDATYAQQRGKGSEKGEKRGKHNQGFFSKQEKFS